MLAISLTLASRSCRDPSPVRQKEEVATEGIRVAPSPLEASRSKKRATSSELGRKGLFRIWALPAAVTRAIWTCNTLLITTEQNHSFPPLSAQLDREVRKTGRVSQLFFNFP